MRQSANLKGLSKQHRIANNNQSSQIATIQSSNNAIVYMNVKHVQTLDIQINSSF